MQLLRVPAHPGPSLDARDDGGKGSACGVADVHIEARKKQLVIPSVEPWKMLLAKDVAMPV